jgi:predicted dehydrogenase
MPVLGCTTNVRNDIRVEVMRALIVGLGSIGRRHLRNLRALVPDADIAVWRQHARPASGAGSDPDADRTVFSLGEALAAHPDVAIIANPTAMHVHTGLQLAHEGISLFVEKPLSNELHGAAELVEVCCGRSLTLMVGYNLRFHRPLLALRGAVQDGLVGRTLSVVAEVGRYLPDWRPGTDYSQGASSRSELGGGAILELSHELDYVRWLVGDVEGVTANAGKVSDLNIDVEDIADIMLRFVGGVFGNVHLDMVQRAPVRTCKVIGTTGTLVWDGMSHHVRHFSAHSGTWRDVFQSAELDWNEMYMNEMRHFLDCADTGTTPLISGEDGLRVLKIALAAKESARLRRAIVL